MPALPRVTYRRLGVNLDTIFGNTLTGVTGEPVTPTKIAIFYLIRTLFHEHFGNRAVPSLKPFGKHEKTRVFIFIYGLILEDSELSYDDFRRVVRMLNDEMGRSIYYRFVTSMQKLAHGDESVDMLFENSFYTSMRSRHDKVRLREFDGPQDRIEFLNKSSFVYIWLKRVMLQYTRTPQSGLFDYEEMMKKWINLGDQELGSPSHFGPDPIFPFEIDCSVRARDWIFHQFNMLQLCPSQAMPFSTILQWSNLVANRHRDIASVHLLMAVVHVQLKNPPDAVKCIKVFFDQSMLEIQEATKMMLKNQVLMAPNQVALKYGPVLQGRVHRLFGDHQYADTLFNEGIQQAQLNAEVMCNRIANMELTTNAILRNGPILEKPYDRDRVSLLNRRIKQQNIHLNADLDRPNPESIFDNDDYQENFEVHSHLLSTSKLLLALDEMMEGNYLTKTRVPLYVFVGLKRPRLICDVRNKRRQMEDYANAVMSSALIQSGMYAQSRRIAEYMMVNNVEAPCTPRLETESYAVGGVNLVYSLCAIGDYPRAFETLQLLDSQFPETINWQSARHIRICSQIIHFERDFLLHRYTVCSRHIQGLASEAPLEYALRHALLLSAMGRSTEGLDVLTKLECGDVRGKIRINMQMATILAEQNMFEMADHHIQEAGKLAHNVSFRDATLLVTRRIASMSLTRREPENAFRVLVELEERVENFGSYIEKAVYYASFARCLRLLGRDPRDFLKKCKFQVLGGRWPAMEKLILTELVRLHSPNGLFPDEMKVVKIKEQFVRIEEKVAGRCTWMLL